MWLKNWNIQNVFLNIFINSVFTGNKMRITRWDINVLLLRRVLSNTVRYQHIWGFIMSSIQKRGFLTSSIQKEDLLVPVNPSADRHTHIDICFTGNSYEKWCFIIKAYSTGNQTYCTSQDTYIFRDCINSIWSFKETLEKI